MTEPAVLARLRALAEQSRGAGYTDLALIGGTRLARDLAPLTFGDIRDAVALIDRLTAERDAARDLAFRAAFGPSNGLDQMTPDEWLPAVHATRGKWPNDPAKDPLYPVIDKYAPDVPETLDLGACGRCGKPFTDDADKFDCANRNDPIHVSCHADSGCTHSECREALSEPYEE